MDVFLLPVGSDRYELYCEVPDEPQEMEADAPRGLFRRLKHRFREMLAQAERDRRQGSPEPEKRGVLDRVQARTLRWVAESIAEQRLLWHLRGQTEATFRYPDDLQEGAAAGLLRQQLGRDFEKHRFWLVIDSLLFISSGLLFFVPGPNFVAYYFLFRLVGHYLSMRGARQGLSGIAWRHEPTPPLTALRRAIDLEPEARERRVQDVATALRLEHLPSFFERSAIPAR
jgi:Mitochondrial K+-H+ exchange-related